MKLKAASGYACIVSDLDKTAKFYEKLGLKIKDRTSNRLIIYLNWYRIDFFTVGKDDNATLQKEAKIKDKGTGVYLYFSVDSVDDTYKEVVKLGLKPMAEAEDESWGNREFILEDPDGYKIVFFKKILRTKGS